MPMTESQLAQATADYHEFIGDGRIVAVEESRPSWRSTCDICGRPFAKTDRWGNTTRRRIAKQLVIVPNYRHQMRHFRALVCRQGIACRARRHQQLKGEDQK